MLTSDHLWWVDNLCTKRWLTSALSCKQQKLCPMLIKALWNISGHKNMFTVAWDPTKAKNCSQQAVWVKLPRFGFYPRLKGWMRALPPRWAQSYSTVSGTFNLFALSQIFAPSVTLSYKLSHKYIWAQEPKVAMKSVDNWWGPCKHLSSPLSPLVERI